LNALSNGNRRGRIRRAIEEDPMQAAPSVM
jgi:hypothetical protein